MKRKVKRKQNQRRESENSATERQRQAEDNEDRRGFRELMLTYGGIGIINFAIEQQQV